MSGINTCVCTSAPSVANGAARYSGPFTNGSTVEFDCNADYTNNGGDSLLCQAADDTCTSTSWVVDSTNVNSGYPDCQAVIPDYDVFNTYNNDSSGSSIGNWGLFALLALLLLLLLIAVILLLWYWCCREQCRACCIRSCPCCRNCCYQIPYSNQYNAQTQPVNHTPTPRRQVNTVYHNSQPNKPAPQEPRVVAVKNDQPPSSGRSSPVTPKKVIVTERREMDDDFYRRHYGYNPYSSNNSVYSEDMTTNGGAGGLEPKEFVKVHKEKLVLPQNAKPVDTKGNPVWMPHHSEMRVGPNHMHTSTK